MISEQDLQFYEENGYLKVQDVIEPALLSEAQAVTQQMIEQSRLVQESNDVFDLDEHHTKENPRLTRIKLPHKQHEVYNRILNSPSVIKCFKAILGPDVVLQSSKLNTKAQGGGAAVEWHQDWAFYPHTNDNILAMGIMLSDVGPENGPLMVIPGSHKGPILNHHRDGAFCGAIDPKDPDFHYDKAVTLTGKAGDITIHAARTLHGSAPNRSAHPRQVYFLKRALLMHGRCWDQAPSPMFLTVRSFGMI